MVETVLSQRMTSQSYKKPRLLLLESTQKDAPALALQVPPLAPAPPQIPADDRRMDDTPRKKNGAPSTPHLLQLDDDLLLHIALYLDTPSCGKLLQSCRRLCQLARQQQQQNEEHWWQQRIWQHYGKHLRFGKF